MSKGTWPAVPAIIHAREQSNHGPAFDVGMCLMQTEIAAFGRHGFGGDTASNGWDLAQHRHPIRKGDTVHRFLSNTPRGFFLWFAGGTPSAKHPEGAGHIGLSGAPFFMWSVDRKRPGFWDRVDVNSMFTWNPSHPLRLLGWSEDIGGIKLPYAPGSKDFRP